MGKKYFILATDKRGSGVAKVENVGGKNMVSFDVQHFAPLRAGEVFKGYVLNGNRFSLLGSMEGGKETFASGNGMSVEGVALVRKNMESGRSQIEFWAGPDNRGTKLLAEAQLGEEAGREKPPEPQVKAREEPAAESQSAPVPYTGEEQHVPEEKPAEDVPPEQEPEEDEEEMQTKPNGAGSRAADEEAFRGPFTFDGFLGGGFDWQRVGGYFSMYHYEIMRHIMASRSLYESVNYFGYYYSGIKSEDEITYIATAIPARTGYAHPFTGMDNFVYSIQDERYSYYVVCAGIDKKGEFFVEI